ncbi:MAG: hypothetical protein R3281_15570 [Balneolaceae bacterium]|nr:hypothetical protein [Balneolaceae bacterium]
MLLAIPLKGFPGVLSSIKPDLNGKIVLDAMNPFPGRDGDVANDILNRGIASGVATQEQLPDAKVAGVFSSVYYKVLQSEAHRPGDRIAIPYAADDDEAREVAQKLIADAGFDPYFLGTLSESKPLDPGGMLFTESYTSREMEEVLS